MTTTRGSLNPAIICEVDENHLPKLGGISVPCMFNPYEYTVSKSNTFTEKSKNAADTPHSEFSKSGAQTLKLNLTFDTYETKRDVSLQTNQLWKLMMVKTRQFRRQNERVEPPQVAFIWGVFRFVAFITNMTQKFTLFTNEGVPVRAKVDVTFTQYTDENDYPGQNPTSGGGPIERIWLVRAGDRLDMIAAEIYRDATKWRMIAEHNDIFNPLVLRPGQRLVIPAL